MSKLKAVLNWWPVLCSIVAAFAFATPFLTSGTADAPSGEAGLYAALIALCAAAMITAEAVNADKMQIRKPQAICIGTCALASAYLWIAAEAEIHPADPQLMAQLSFIWIAVLLAFVIPLIVLVSRKR